MDSNDDSRRRLGDRRVRHGRDGRDGKDGRNGVDGRSVKGDRGENGLQGERGLAGKQGARGPIGPMPAHRWIEQTKLQFEQAPGGEWGDAVELRGPKGDPGALNVAGQLLVRGGGAPSVAAGSGGGANGYFPGGWT